MSAVSRVMGRLRAIASHSAGRAQRGPAGSVSELRLRDNEATSFQARPGYEITCKQGSVLVTQEGDAADHVLETGDMVRISRVGKLAALALSDSLLTVHSASSPARQVRRARAGGA